jgi:alpha-beta hydrolase superfamily lysophospholipase
MAERVSFKTADDVTIVADWVTSPTTVGAVILLHMMPANRHAWGALQATLATRGLSSLAIDLRGHGDSTVGPGGARVDFKNFSDEEHQSSLMDVIAAYDWLTRRGYTPSQIAVGGASIGANLAVQMLVEEPRLAAGILLSPGRYRGMDASADATSILPNQALWVAASEGDDKEAFEVSKQVVTNATSERKMFVPLKNAGHGLAILASQVKMPDQIADWLRDTIQNA